uniref:Transposase n=2 Tax=Escherichia coli TaxID=562 RepID=A0A0S3PMY9_ECOLX|nr:transposase [Escherichia coli O169:H41]
MLSTLQLVATPAAPAAQALADALLVIKDMYKKQLRKVPATAPLEFVPESWRKVVITPTGIDRQYYECCALSELKGALRSGDIWVKGSRRYKNFDDYLIPEKDFDKLSPALPLPVSADYHKYITNRMILLQSGETAVTGRSGVHHNGDREKNGDANHLERDVSEVTEG